ncbi:MULTISPECIES: hypothetical protein [Myxococcus]|nr:MULTISPECIES: hypothetical protein [Myxococcus]QZZ49851.1 hypothetical protein MyxoNM_11655 [Myxococcus xanthus]UYI16805.1 hypothetical protein N3T43_10995 [Myxococcus xanthus]UYI24272.1 hypothetical protein N1129_11535 [Myxococcus xanthus]SDY28127.1 hypothetical protein SAMN05444383_1313 [Myxococcus xanthus]
MGCLGFLRSQQAQRRIGEWIGLDAGVLAEGRRADLAIINPEGLDGKLDEIAEAPMENFGGFVRLVRRNDAAVKAVLNSGREAVREGAVAPSLGRERGFGKVLRAQYLSGMKFFPASEASSS